MPWKLGLDCSRAPCCDLLCAALHIWSPVSREVSYLSTNVFDRRNGCMCHDVSGFSWRSQQIRNNIIQQMGNMKYENNSSGHNLWTSQFFFADMNVVRFVLMANQQKNTCYIDWYWLELTSQTPPKHPNWLSPVKLSNWSNKNSVDLKNTWDDV